MSKKLVTGGILAALLTTAGAAGVVASQTVAFDAPTLTEAQAVEIALAEVPGEVQEAELEREDGMHVYEIEILTADGAEMDVEINADTGEIFEIEAEDVDDDDDDDFI